MSWNKVKISEILKQYRIEHRVQNDITYKQVSILNDGRVVLRGEKIGREIGRKRQFLIDLNKFPKTLIFTRQLLLQGSIGLASSDVHNCIVTENMPMFSINDTKIDIDYLLQFIKSKQFKNQVERIELTGSAQKSIHEKTFLQLEIPLPSISEQKAIVDLLKIQNSNIDAISTELTHQLTLVKQLRQAFLSEAMQGKLVESEKLKVHKGAEETGQQLLERIRKEKQDLIKNGKLKKEKPLPPIKPEEIPFEIPEDWVWCRFGDISTSHDGQRVPLSEYQRSKIKGNYDYYGAQGVIDGINDYMFDGIYLLIAEDGQNLLRKNKPVAIIASGKFWVNNHAHVSNCIHDETRSFLLNYINTIDLAPFISGKPPSQIKLNRRQLDLIPVPLPPLSTQQHIVAKLDQLMSLCDGLESSIKSSKEQNDMLLQEVLREAMEGKKYEMVREELGMAAEANVEYKQQIN